MTHALIESDELLKRLDSVKIIDASYGGDAQENWTKSRIGNAIFFDIDEVADHGNDMPHMLPSPEDFARAVSAMGISNDDEVVVYDQSGMAMAASRVWWMFRIFGHDKVRVLNGGLPDWLKQGHPCNTDAPAAPSPATFTATFKPELVQSMKGIMQAVEEKTSIIIDARGTSRFSGEDTEQNPDMRSGHIPGSHNIPFAMLLDPETGKMKDIDALREIFGAVPANAHIVISCGSGVTACVIALGFHLLGRADIAIYDGSWTEWGRKASNTPVGISA